MKPTIIIALVALIFSLPTAAQAGVQTALQQGCIATLNKGGARVLRTQGKDARKCHADFANGKLADPAKAAFGNSADACITSDRKGKVRKAKDKITIEDEPEKCLYGTGQPDFGAGSTTVLQGDNANTVAVNAALILMQRLFGRSISAGTVSKAEDKKGAVCQQGVVRSVQKCVDTKIKEFNRCKNDGLKQKMPPGSIDDAATLQTLCFNTITADLKQKIAKACGGVTEKGIDSAVVKKCHDKGQTAGAVIDALFPAMSVPVTTASLDMVSECIACRWINKTDGLNEDCDLFDNGQLDDSCPAGISSPSIVFIVPSDTDEITVAWMPGADGFTELEAPSHEVHASTIQNFTPSPATLVETVARRTGLLPEVTITDLQAGTTYYVVVVARGTNGGESNSGQASATTLATPVVFNATVPLEDASTLNLGEPTVDIDTYTFDSTGPGQPPTEGAILIGSIGDEGFLRRVDTVTTAGNQIIVETSYGRLSDAVDEIRISSSHTLFDADAAAERVLAGARQRPLGSQPAGVARSISPQGERVSRLEWAGGTLVAEQVTHAGRTEEMSFSPGARAGEFNITASPRTPANTLGIAATVDFEPDLSTEARWSVSVFPLSVQLQSAEFIATGTLSVDILAEYLFGGALVYNQDILLFTRTYNSVYLVGGVVIFQQITFTLDAVVSATASAQVEATADAKAVATVQAGVRYNPGTGDWDSIYSENFSNNLTAALGTSGGVTGEVRLIPRIEVGFYRVVTGAISVEPSLNGVITAQGTSSPRCGPFELTAFDFGLGLECFADANLNVLLANITLLEDYPICTPKTFPLFDLPEASLGAGPSSGGAVPLTATVPAGTNNPLDMASIQWDVSPNTAQIVPATGNLGPALECDSTDTYTVTFSGHGALGELARRCVTTDVDCTAVEPCGTYITKWGSNGTGDGQFTIVEDVALDATGNVYVADHGFEDPGEAGFRNSRIQKFDSAGTFITEWGSTGPGDGQFDDGPIGIALDAAGNVYAADATKGVLKFDSTGTFVAWWDFSAGKIPRGIAATAAGIVYVAVGEDGLLKYDSDGNRLNNLLDSVPQQRGSFEDVAVDAAGNVYAFYSGVGEVLKFNSSDALLTSWGSDGFDDGQFAEATAIGADAAGNVYVGDTQRDDIQKFDSVGTFITKWGRSGSGNGRFREPTGIAVDAAGSIYTADRGNVRITKFACPE